jgi:hypothetical protein
LASWPRPSIIEALAVIGLAVGGFIAYREVMQLGANLEARQIAPLREKVDAILLDVKAGRRASVSNLSVSITRLAVRWTEWTRRRAACGQACATR